MAKANYRVRRYNSAARPQLKALVVWKDDAGKRQKQFFNTVKEAETFAAQRETELLNQGREALSFSSGLRVMAQECQNALCKHGKTLRDATAHYLEYLRRTQASAPIEFAAEEFLSVKERRATPLNHRYMRRIRCYLLNFRLAFPGKLVSEFTAKDCEDWLASKDIAAATRNGNTLFLREFFKWCKSRRWCEDNPANGVEWQREIESAVGILTVDQATRLLEAADTAMLPYVAIGLFAGIRAAELVRLDWSEIDLEDGFIEITAAKAKSARRRLVKIQPCLRAWIEPFAKAKGKVAPSNIDYHLRRISRRAEIIPWPRNALRHSFASYHIAHFKNAAELALEMGHNSTKLIFQHYRQMVRESQAIEFWNIVPDEPENLVRLAAQNTVVLLRSEQDLKRGATGRFKPVAWVAEYQHSQAHYQKVYGVKDRKTISKWMHMGKPLDDPQAMAKIARGEYAHTIREQVTIYQTTIGQVRHWRRYGWPLDDVERMKAYIAFRDDRFKGAFAGPAIKSLRVIPLSQKDARAAAETQRAAKQA